MTTLRAYCSACDTQIAVRVPPDGIDHLGRRDLDCPHGALCGGPGCVLETADVPLRDALEFLPRGAGGASPRRMDAASRLVESGRRASLAREIRRWRLWWGGR